MARKSKKFKENRYKSANIGFISLKKSDQGLQKAIDLHNSGDLQQAEKLYRQILQQDPQNSDAHHLLGLIAYQVKKYDAAIACIEKALALKPSTSVYHLNIGNVYKAQGDFMAALKSYEKAISLHPNYPDAFYNCGIIYQNQGKLDTAIAHYKKALQLKPDHARAHNNLGNTLKEKGDLDAALHHFLEAIRLEPVYAYAHNNAANIYKTKKNMDAALHHYNEALNCNPAYADAHYNMGIILKDRRKITEAARHFRKAIKLDPTYHKAFLNLGLILQRNWKFDEALRHYREALRLKPDLEDAYNNIGVILKEQGKLEEAYDSFYKSMEIKPEFHEAHSNLLLNMHYHASFDNQHIFDAHRTWAQQHAALPTVSTRPLENVVDPDRRLRIGYISPDFRRHSVSFFIEPVLANHDHAGFEIFCYADVAEPDNVTKRLQDYADSWHSIKDMSYEEVCDLVRADRIDILVDLAGHTAHNRMPVFARKPAPVQVGYLGYPDTTGLPTMDYRITDNHADPQGTTEQFYTERLVRLPGCFLCYRPYEKSPDVAPLPALTNGHITFGSFNALPKITPDVVDLWSQILQVVSGSRLMLKCGQLTDETARGLILEMFKQHGISSERIELIGQVPTLTEHLAFYGKIDIALDPFPYNGTTTTCEALWMGVPVITYAGTRHSARVGSSLLKTVGLDDLVAESHGVYVVKAVQLAGDLNRLKALRAGLRNMLRSSVLTSPRIFTRALEKEYRRIWHQWCTHVAGLTDIETKKQTAEAQKSTAKSLTIRRKPTHPGWTVFNISDAPQVDHAGDMRDLSLFEDGAFSEISASRVLERLERIDELPGVLQEWYRVLTPGGKLTINIFDLDKLCRLMLMKDRLSMHERLYVMKILFTGNDNPGSYNRLCLNAEFLESYLHNAGFKNITVIDASTVSEDPHLLKICGFPVTLTVVSEKPAAPSKTGKAGGPAEGDDEVLMVS